MRLATLVVPLRAALRLYVLTIVVVILASLAVAESARANLLSPAVRTLPVTAPSIGGASVGSAVLAVTYTDTDATAIATAPSVALGKGQRFRLQMCVKAHSHRASLETRCDEKLVDTDGLLGGVTVAAPTVRATLARPGSRGSAYFSYLLSVQYRQQDGTYKEVASSWPGGGLGSVYVGVPSRGSSTSPTPASEGLPLTNNPNTGGINTGLADSMCTGSGGDPASPLPEGVSNAGLGPDAPAYYEIGEPTGDYAGRPPVGVMMLIHGGGWHYTGPAGVSAIGSKNADRWRARGWRTLNVTYAPCAGSFHDVRWFYDRARELWGDSLPYCALGASAGGNLALMLAYARPTLDCAIDQGGPTDALALRNQSTPIGGTNGPRWIYNGLAAAVGSENVAWWSPVRFPIHARVLFAVAARDPFIPYAQGTALREKVLATDPGGYADTMRLAAGDLRWVHGKVSADALATYYEREEQLVAPLVREPAS